MMCEPAWKEWLNQKMARLEQAEHPARVAVIGIGHPLRGDDAAGVALVERLKRLTANADQILLIAGGAAPENCTGQLRRFRPDLVLLVDAACLDEKAGTVRWLRWEDTASYDASTHAVPLRLFASYLKASLGCEVGLLGIQPASLELGAPISPQVRRAVSSAARDLAILLTQSEVGDEIRECESNPKNCAKPGLDLC